MLDTWFEHVILRRLIANGVKLAISSYIAHQMVINGHLSAAGITVTVDQVKLGEFLNAASFLGLQELHMWVIAKFPELGKWL